jgi:hypothetical protein
MFTEFRICFKSSASFNQILLPLAHPSLVLSAHLWGRGELLQVAFITSTTCNQGLAVCSANKLEISLKIYNSENSNGFAKQHSNDKKREKNVVMKNRLI